MSYEIRLTDTFKKKAARFFKKHPDLLDRYGKTLRLLQENPFHPSLRLHKLQGKLNDYHSVSIDMSYRITIDFLITESAIIPIDIGSHDDVY